MWREYVEVTSKVIYFCDIGTQIDISGEKPNVPMSCCDTLSHKWKVSEKSDFMGIMLCDTIAQTQSELEERLTWVSHCVTLSHKFKVREKDEFMSVSLCDTVTQTQNEVEKWFYGCLVVWHCHTNSKWGRRTIIWVSCCVTLSHRLEMREKNEFMGVLLRDTVTQTSCESLSHCHANWNRGRGRISWVSCCVTLSKEF